MFNLLINHNFKHVSKAIFDHNDVGGFLNINYQFEKTTIGRIMSNLMTEFGNILHDKNPNINWF